MAAAVPTQARSGAESPRDAAARLALVELLLFSDDAAECARATVDWLAERGGARKSICALIDAESGTLKHVAAAGVSEGQIESLHLALEAPDDPLVFALAGREPVSLGKRRAPDSWRNEFLAIPLPLSEAWEARQGLLLVSPARCEPEARWAAEMLGQKIARLRASAATAGSAHKVQRERELLLNILNASPDPILLTDPEGRMIIDSAADPILVTDSSGKILLMNSPAERLFTATSEQLEEKVREATAELVRCNELLQRQHLELEQASQLKSQFLANMSHEFRTPLNAILGYTSMLLQGVSGDLAAPQKNKMLRVDSNARHLLSIINDILDISRIEAGKMPLHLEEFEDFRQADNSVTREYGGAGLGLAICRRLAKMLDGRIELQSRLGRGSTFTLVIPRKGKRR